MNMLSINMLLILIIRYFVVDANQIGPIRGVSLCIHSNDTIQSKINLLIGEIKVSLFFISCNACRPNYQQAQFELTNEIALLEVNKSISLHYSE